MKKRILPIPKKLTEGEGTVKTPLCVSTSHQPWEQYVNTFCISYNKIYCADMKIAEGGIRLVYDPEVEAGTYTFDADEEIMLCASDDEGICYAMATALLALEHKGDFAECEKMHIEDSADKPFRALMVDLARQWHPMRTVLKYVDVCFMLKLPFLHLHFIDDQRYTLPSKVFPEISTKVQSYTFDEIKELNEYAAQRGVTIIPEFEAPGHAASFVRAYPEVFANKIEGDSPTITTESGVVVKATSLVCAGKSACMDGIRALLTEICEMFPDSPYIHIGGDEANIAVWDYCDECKKYMKDNGIEDVYDLYAEFDARVAQTVLDLGRTPIVWEGFSAKGAHRIPKETIVIAWESYYNLAPDLLEQGFNIINASWQPLYIVPSTTKRWGVDEIMEWNVHEWQHWWDNSAAKLNPIHVEPTDRVLGAQLCSWECTYEQEINRVMENCTALSERTWNTFRTQTMYDFKKSEQAVCGVIRNLIQER